MVFSFEVIISRVVDPYILIRIRILGSVAILTDSDPASDAEPDQPLSFIFPSLYLSPFLDIDYDINDLCVFVSAANL